MKLNSFLAIAALAALTFTACEPETQEEAMITANPSSLQFDENGDPENGTGKITLHATRDWRVSSELPAWLGLSKTSGIPSKDDYVIDVTVDPNEGNDRDAEIVFTIGLYNASVSIHQKGAEGEIVYEQLTCAEFIQKADTANVYRLVGKVSSFNPSYCSFNLTDDTGTVVIWEVNNKGEWQDVIKNGGTATVRGVYKAYESNGSIRHEMVSAYIEEFVPGAEGTPKGDGTLQNPYNPAGAAKLVENFTWTSTTEYDASEPVYVKGKVSAVSEEFTTDFGNASFTIVDAEDGSGVFEAYRVLYVGNRRFKANDTQIKVGDVVVVYGKVMNYRGTTPESTSGSFLYELNGVSDGGVIEQGTPEGDGSLEKPFNVSAANNAVANLTWTAIDNYEKVGPFYIKGKVSQIDEEYSTQFGNATFNITDLDGKSSLVAYRVKYLGNSAYSANDEQIKVGDEVIIYGEIMNYRGTTAETVSGAYLYSLNGNVKEMGTPKGDGTLQNPYNPAGVAAAAAQLTWTADTLYQTIDSVYIKGKISKIANQGTYTEGGTYGNASFYITDSEDGTGEFYVFRAYYLKNKKFESGQTDIKVGDEVIVCGTVMNYRNNTPETVAGKSYLYSLNGDKGQDAPAGNPQGNGTVDSPYNPAAANKAAAALTWTSTTVYQTVDNVYIKGKISKIASQGTYTEGGTYGNASFYIEDPDDPGVTFYVFRAYYLKNKKFESGQTDIKVGDEVVVCGSIMNYQGNTPETVAGKAYLYSLNGDQGVDASAGTAKGTGTLNDPYNPAGAAAAVANFTWTSTTVYQKTESDVYIKGKISKIANNGTYTDGGTFGNASFYITDSEDGTGEFYIFRALYLKNQKFTTGQTDIKVGDEVIVCGKIMNYQGNTPETVSGESYLYSLNGATESAVAPLFGVAKTDISVSASATSAVVSVTGNSPWTVSGDGLQFSVTEGEGAGDFTVYFPANEDEENAKVYTLTVSTTAQVATQSITVTITQAKKPAAGTVTSHVYTKVTSALNSYEGKYLIVYDKYAFDGSLTTLDAVNDYQEVTVSDNSITLSEETDTFFFTIAKSGDSYTIQSQSGYYIYQTSDANGLGSSNSESKALNSISVNASGEADIASSGAHLRYNSASNQNRFRYYKSSSYTNQKAISLYKLTE